ncbi:hypothetical protein FYK55_07470 [Roseiconus nitratireducens]|uniref:Uncharacterized protein n=1 Tax=Roseiconus nitratireducens TaxID=2605748 RepID=A0A5M6DD89_9BACT|nr:hypothetical protein [Roseiconus nitratireducens]KAA5545478.1 hypothetical protein FYK55_07470 [Roseiconus nitratireducens]
MQNRSSKTSMLTHAPNVQVLVKSCAAVAALMVPLALSAQTATAQQYEWEPGYGYHEEEWYDPSDWFGNDDDVSYEDAYDSYYGNYDDDYYGEYYDNDEFASADDYYEEQPRRDRDSYRDQNRRGYFTSDWFDQSPGFDAWYDAR